MIHEAHHALVDPSAISIRIGGAGRIHGCLVIGLGRPATAFRGRSGGWSGFHGIVAKRCDGRDVRPD